MTFKMIFPFKSALNNGDYLSIDIRFSDIAPKTQANNISKRWNIALHRYCNSYNSWIQMSYHL